MIDAQDHSRAVTDLVNRLVDALSGRGLVAESFGANMVRVRIDLPDGESPGARTGSTLRQTVLCRPDRTGALAWWWLWSAPGEELEQEWLCPGEEITIAVNAIVRVLAVRPFNEPFSPAWEGALITA